MDLSLEYCLLECESSNVIQIIKQYPWMSDGIPQNVVDSIFFWARFFTFWDVALVDKSNNSMPYDVASCFLTIIEGID